MLTNIFESHAHYYNNRFDDDRDQLLTSLHANGLRYVMNIGADLESSAAVVALADRYDFCYATVGVHPTDTSGLPGDYLEQLARLAAHPKVRAIGEIGLDYFHDPEGAATQPAFFAQQLELARDLDLPVVIHDRDAHGDTMDMLARYRPRGVVHCYSGSAEMAQELVKLGFYIGFTGVVTFKNARRALEAAAVVPADRLLVETDCPYMAPEPYRGQRCHSGMLVQVLEKLAELRGVSAQSLADQTCRNAQTLFNIT